MDKREYEMILALKDGRDRKGKDLAYELSISDRSVRNIIKELNSCSVDNGMIILSKYGIGYRLEVQDKERFETFVEKLQCKNKIPNSSKEREQYLLEYLLTNGNYTKLDDLSQALFVSKKTLTHDLKSVEQILAGYNLEIIRKPNYGIKVSGKEYDLRRCIANVIETVNPDLLKMSGRYQRNEAINTIKKIVQHNLDKYNFNMSSQAAHNLTIHIFVAITRIREGLYISIKKTEENLIHQVEYEIADTIVNEINKTFQLEFPKSEIIYIGIHLASKQTYGGKNEKGCNNTVISQKIADLVEEMLKRTDLAYPFAMLNDLELRMNLCQHIIPLEVRIFHDMKMHNPMLKEIKEKYFLSYSMAMLACTVLENHYHKRMSEDEIGYFALSFALALERQRTNVAKKNILLVCASGKGSTQFLRYKYENEFAAYINTIADCDISSLAKVDFSQVDYIFSTVPIHINVPVPIQEVNYFLDDEGIVEVKKILAFGNENSIETYYSNSLFLSHIKCKTKDDVLKYMCEYVMEHKNLSQEFYESVLERENLACTTFGNKVAMPHPCKLFSIDSFVCIGILEEPVLWENHQVQVIFLVSIGKKKKKTLQRFYQITSKFLHNSQDIGEIIKNRNFELFINRLKELEK